MTFLCLAVVVVLAVVVLVLLVAAVVAAVVGMHLVVIYSCYYQRIILNSDFSKLSGSRKLVTAAWAASAHLYGCCCDIVTFSTSCKSFLFMLQDIDSHRRLIPCSEEFGYWKSRDFA